MNTEITDVKAENQAAVVSSCFCKNADFTDKEKCKKQCCTCERLQIEYSFKNNI